MNTEYNLYFHVPFCLSKCNYCAFNSCANKNPDWDKYATDICREINKMAKFAKHPNVTTVFFGGGTPSLMPVDTFSQILNCVRDNFNILPDCEITIESNPKTLTREKLQKFMDIGLNRLSVGVQSLRDSELKFMGRNHNAADALELMHLAKDLNLSVSGDFIYGLPGQTSDDVKQMCENINKLQLTHCSMYELTIEENTPFGKMNLDMPDNDTMADMFNIIQKHLNLPRYEVSNYGTKECRHNKNIWAGKPYIGFGKYAAGRLFIDGVWYEQMGLGELLKPISNYDRNIEKLILGLRTKYGVLLNDDIYDIIDIDYINKNNKLIRIENDHLIATNDGLIVLDDILLNLIKG